MSVSERYAFGDFVLERSMQRVLHRDGTQLSLTPRLFSALLLFAERAGDLLDKDTLMLALWPGLVVEENNLSQVISGLRRALGDDTHGSRYIQTVPRRGFRFIAAVTALPGAAELINPPVITSMSIPVAPQPLAGGEPNAAPRAIRESDSADKRRWLRLALATSAVAVLGGTGWWAWLRLPATGLAALGATLAVLPFRPLVAEARDELLEVGMADSLVSRLSTVPGLVVRSIGSVRRYAGPDQDPMRAARELDVTWIVDGSLQRRGDQLRVTARLLRSADGSAAWSGSFDEKFTGVFDMQDLISNRVMQALQSTLQAAAPSGTPANATLTNEGGTHSTEAYELYLAASRHAQGLRVDGLRKSIELLNQALAVDPAYALAWVELAQVHRRRLFSADAAPTEVFEPIKVALQRALAVAPNLAQARTEVAYTLYWYDFDWAGAEREFRHALATNPNVAMAHFGLGMLMATQDQPDEGFRHLRKARELDPMSPIFNTIEAGYLIDAGRRAEARSRLARVFDIAPNFWLAHATQGLLYFAEQQPGPGIAALRRAVELTDGSTQPSVLLAVHLVQVGRPHEARAILNQMLARARERYVPPTSLAAVHAALGESAPALDLLEQALPAHDTRLIVFKDDPRWASLRKEPRFVALLKKLKLDRYGSGLSPP
ncbi:hypothetical protein BH11PSE10_BH11PSE10_10820 [soil metagenome]